MVTLLGRNPSTGNLLRGPGGKLCRGCCEEPAEPCQYCPSGTTPLQLMVSFSGLTDLCGGCMGAGDGCGELGSKLAAKFDFSFADLLNGTHILTQRTGSPSSFRNCQWQINFDLGEDRNIELWCNHPFFYWPCPDCVAGGAGPSFTFEAESEAWPLGIQVAKLSATTYRVMAIAPLLSAQMAAWDANTTGSESCFELDGSLSYDSTVMIMGSPNSLPLVSDGNVAVYPIDACDGAPNWSAGTYEYLETVHYLVDGFCYICVVSSTTSTPGTDDDWVKVE